MSRFGFDQGEPHGCFLAEAFSPVIERWVIHALLLAEPLHRQPAHFQHYNLPETIQDSAAGVLLRNRSCHSSTMQAQPNPEKRGSTDAYELHPITLPDPLH